MILRTNFIYIVFLSFFAFISVYAADIDYQTPENNFIDDPNVGGIEDEKSRIDSNSLVIEYSNIKDKTIDRIQDYSGNYKIVNAEDHTDDDINASEMLDRGRNVDVSFNSLVDRTGKFSINTQKLADLFVDKNSSKEYFGNTKYNLKAEDIIASDLNKSDLIKGMQNGIAIRSLVTSNSIVVPNYIECYISRELTPMFYCPFEEITAMYGGNIDSMQDEAKSDCDNSCKRQTLCVKSPILLGDLDIVFSEGSTLNLLSNYGTEEEFLVSSKSSLSYIELNFHIDKINEGRRYYIKYVISGLDYISGEWRDISRDTTISLENNDFLYRVYTNGVFEKIKLKFFVPYFVDNNQNTVYFYDETNTTLRTIDVRGNLVYEDDALFYCPDTQFVNSGSFVCTGEVVLKEINGVDRLICKMPESYISGPEPETGAFYSEASCNDKCFIQEECLPTYTFPDGSGTISVSSYQSKVGCVDDPNNFSCTEEKCQQAFLENNASIFEERNYINEIESELTISSGSVLAQRPAIDYEAEVSNIVTPGSLTFLEEMKDGAYVYMSNRLNYNYTKKFLSEKTDIQLEKKLLKTVDDYSLGLKVKPSNVDFDNQRKYRYIILKVWQSYTKEGITYGDSSSDDKTMFQDLMYLEYIGLNSLRTFKIFPEVKFLVEDISADLNSSSDFPSMEWQDSSVEIFPIEKKWDDLLKVWVAYDTNDYIVSYDSSSFMKGYLYDDINVIQDVYNFFDSSDGILIKKQELVSGSGKSVKIYSGAKDVTTVDHDGTSGSLFDIKAYFFYSDTPISYRNIENYLVEENVFFQHTSRDLYGEEIIGDGTINNNIQIFLQGDINNMSLYLKLKAKNGEIGKNGFIFTLMK